MGTRRCLKDQQELARQYIQVQSKTGAKDQALSWAHTGHRGTEPRAGGREEEERKAVSAEVWRPAQPFLWVSRGMWSVT